MPNGNIIQAVCDANFFNASNSDPDPDAPNGNSSNNYFPPVYSTPRRAQNSRLLVIDQETLEVIDEYSAPKDPRWTCMAGIAFSDEGMFVSMFHGAAVFVIDWQAGIDNEKSEGVGSNSPHGFKFGKKKNVAKIIRVIDMLGDESGPGHPRDADGFGPGQGNEGCAQPIATFFGAANGEDNVDPRMLMVIHESFVQ